MDVHRKDEAHRQDRPTFVEVRGLTKQFGDITACVIPSSTGTRERMHRSAPRTN
jgi:hypothetical protein